MLHTDPDGNQRIHPQLYRKNLKPVATAREVHPRKRCSPTSAVRSLFSWCAPCNPGPAEVVRNAKRWSLEQGSACPKWAITPPQTVTHAGKALGQCPRHLGEGRLGCIGEWWGEAVVCGVTKVRSKYIEDYQERGFGVTGWAIVWRCVQCVRRVACVI